MIVNIILIVFFYGWWFYLHVPTWSSPAFFVNIQFFLLAFSKISSPTDQDSFTPLFLRPIGTRKYHRGASVPKKIWPLPGTKYHCQRTKNRDFRQFTRVQWKNVNHIAGGVVKVYCSNSYHAKYARRATSNQFWPIKVLWKVDITSQFFWTTFRWNSTRKIVRWFEELINLNHLTIFIIVFLFYAEKNYAIVKFGNKIKLKNTVN